MTGGSAANIPWGTPPLWVPSPGEGLRPYGAAAGVAIALGWTLLTGPSLAGMVGSPDEPAGLVPPMLAAGSAGWLLAPRAARASGPSSWIGLGLLLDVIVVVLGAVIVAVVMFVGASVAEIPEQGFGLLVAVLPTALMLAGLGIVFLGPLAIPQVAIPAALWVLVMWAITRHGARPAE